MRPPQKQDYLNADRPPFLPPDCPLTRATYSHRRTITERRDRERQGSHIPLAGTGSRLVGEIADCR